MTNEALADMIARVREDVGPQNARIAQLEAGLAQQAQVIAKQAEEIAGLKENDHTAQEAVAKNVERLELQMKSNHRENQEAIAANHRDNQEAIAANRKADEESDRKLDAIKVQTDAIKVQNGEQSNSLADLAKNTKPILQGAASWLGWVIGAALAAYFAAKQTTPAVVATPAPAPIVIPVNPPPAGAAPAQTTTTATATPSGAPR